MGPPSLWYRTVTEGATHSLVPNRNRRSHPLSGTEPKGGFSEQPDSGAKPGFQTLVPRSGFQGFRLWGPNAWGSRSLSVVAIVPGPSQTLNTSASGPNSLRTWRQAPQGAVGVWVGV